MSAKCFLCHGPDEMSREADLRLDLADDATMDRGGYAAIVPGDPAGSEILLRIEDPDPDMKMPPASSGKTLTLQEIELIKQWIAEGAQYEEHWSFQEVERPTLPIADGSVHPIDQFIQRKLDEEGLAPAEPADPHTLIRRVHLDLIGLPPSVEVADAFAADPSPEKYEQLIDELLASPHYGEKWGRHWLDLARYSDTKGYEKDRPRVMWLYRDWVIDAINNDLPFDQFTIEQLAGDMLSDPTVSQLIATGFHRNTMTNEEGGIDPQEFRYLSVVDRVATTGATWMGLTLGCAQCHTHKYDPITHNDYFSLFAVFNNADEPRLDSPTEATSQAIDEHNRLIESTIEGLQDKLIDKLGDPEAAQTAWREWVEQQRPRATEWSIQRPTGIETNLPDAQVLDDHSVLISGDVTNADRYELTFEAPTQEITALRLEALPHPALPRGGSGRRVIGEDDGSGQGDFLLTELQLAVIDPEGDSRGVSLKSASTTFAPEKFPPETTIDGRLDTGWSVRGRQYQRQTLVVVPESPISLQPNEQLVVTLRHDSFYPAGMGCFRLSFAHDGRAAEATGLSDESLAALLSGDDRFDPESEALLWRDFLLSTPLLADEQEQIAELYVARPLAESALVFKERRDSPRVTHRHHRGEYLKAREEVAPNTPQCLPGMEPDTPVNRLTFARWLVDRKNPLTARVIANRYWQTFFGAGLVKTSEDFGMQGEYPSHPELLDWLAARFMENGWSRKQLHRQIVTSDTYKQSSSNAESFKKDPENRLLARSPRIRLDAEITRDVVLKTGGLLSSKLGGPSVFPPQPPGITEAAYGPLNWITSEGEDRYRRGLYTFNKRTAPYAAFGLFDAPSGESCLPRRNRSNTPLQALAMMNDEAVIEAARSLAAQVHSSEGSDEQRAEMLLRRAITRPVSSDEIASVVSFVAAQRDKFQDGTLSPQQVLNCGPKQAWSFDTPDHGWVAKHEATITELSGQLQVTSLGEDPQLGVPATGPAGVYSLRLTTTGAPKPGFELFWTTEKQPQESASRRVLPGRAPGKGYEYRATFTANSPLRGLRLDPGSGPGEVVIQSAELIYGDGLLDLSSVEDPAELASWSLAARAVLNLDEVITKP